MNEKLKGPFVGSVGGVYYIDSLGRKIYAASKRDASPKRRVFVVADQGDIISVHDTEHGANAAAKSYGAGAVVSRYEVEEDST